MSDVKHMKQALANLKSEMRATLAERMKSKLAAKSAPAPSSREPETEEAAEEAESIEPEEDEEEEEELPPSIVIAVKSAKSPIPAPEKRKPGRPRKA